MLHRSRTAVSMKFVSAIPTAETDVVSVPSLANAIAMRASTSFPALRIRHAAVFRQLATRPPLVAIAKKVSKQPASPNSWMPSEDSATSSPAVKIPKIASACPAIPVDVSALFKR